MNPITSESLVNAAKKFTEMPFSELPKALNDTLNDFLCWPFKATEGAVIDSKGNETNLFNTIIYLEKNSKDLVLNNSKTQADDVAVLIDVYKTVDLNKFKAAYNRIVNAKKLEKSTSSNLANNNTRTETLGIIFTIDSEIPLQKLAEELGHLNASTPNIYWPDIVVVLSQGIINYAIQFPCHKEINDFLLPGKKAFRASAFYVIMAIKPDKKHTLHKMCSLLLGHLNSFLPGTNLPDPKEVTKNIPNTLMVVTAYQNDIEGKLCPTPPYFYIGKHLPQPILILENKSMKISATLQFVKWQDGSVLILHGNLSLEQVLNLLNNQILLQNNTHKIGQLQISSVLSITPIDFDMLVKKLQTHLNLKVRIDSHSWVKKRIANEGIKSPFIARIFFGILTLKEHILQDNKVDQFDKLYEQVLTALLDAKEASTRVIELFALHVEKIRKGETARIINNSIHIDEPIDRELRRDAGNFLTDSVIALKHSMQNLTKALDVDISYLFKQDDAFFKGINQIKDIDYPLATYLLEARKWTSQLVKSRNKMQHEGWRLPDIEYTNHSDLIQIKEPEIANQPALEFIKIMLDRLTCFIEDILIHCLQKYLPDGFSIFEIPISNRDSETPVRFYLALTSTETLPWSISYSKDLFEEK